jgi:hypothetical protein
MDFMVLTLAPVPDVAAARCIHQLDELEASAVAKALEHQRKQAAGNEQLRWDQCAIGAATLLSRFDDQLTVESWAANSKTDDPVVRALAERLEADRPLLYWDPLDRMISVLRFRGLAHRVAMPRIWGDDGGRNLASAFVGGPAGPPSLDALVGQLGLPTQDAGPQEAVDHWLQGDSAALRRHVVWEGLQLYLVTLRFLQARGELDMDAGEKGQTMLKDWLATRLEPWLEGFSAAMSRLD